MTRLDYMNFELSKVLLDEDVGLMTYEQFGVYMKLLCWQWVNGSLPNDSRALAKLLGIPEDHFTTKIWKPVVGKKFVIHQGRLGNPMLAESRAATANRVEASRASGRKGGRPKTIQEPSNNLEVPSRLSQTEPSSNLDQSNSKGKSKSKSKSKTTKERSTSLSFAQKIYEAYPRHVGRAKALPAIEKAIEITAARNGSMKKDAAAWLLERVQQFAASPAGKAGTFTPYPATWMNGGRFDDDDAEWQRTDDGTAGRNAQQDSRQRGQDGGAQQRRAEKSARELTSDFGQARSL